LVRTETDFEDKRYDWQEADASEWYTEKTALGLEFPNVIVQNYLFIHLVLATFPYKIAQIPYKSMMTLSCPRRLPF